MDKETNQQGKDFGPGEPDPRCMGAALRYAARGWHVIPVCGIDDYGEPTCGRDDCSSPGKHPLIKGWSTRATTNPETIRQWWDRWPQANVGVLTGKRSGLAVLDVDDPEAVDELEAKPFYTPPQIGPVSTTGRGYHFWFACPPSRSVSCATNLRGIQDLDIRGDSGFVVAPPSRHPSGATYQWSKDPDSSVTRDDSFSLGPAPSWMSKSPDQPSAHDDAPRTQPRTNPPQPANAAPDIDHPDDYEAVIATVEGARRWLEELDEAIRGERPGGYENDTSRSGQDQSLAYWCAHLFNGDLEKVYAAVRHYSHRPGRHDDHCRAARKGVALWEQHQADQGSGRRTLLNGAAAHLVFDSDAVTRKDDLVSHLDDLGVSVSKTFLTRRMQNGWDVEATRRRINGGLVRVWVGVRLYGPSLARARFRNHERSPLPQLCMSYNPEHLGLRPGCDGSSLGGMTGFRLVDEVRDIDRPPPTEGVESAGSMRARSQGYLGYPL